MSSGSSPAGLLPAWLGVIWTLVFVAVALSHLRYLAGTEGQRRAWHTAHVLIAVGMAFMYAPAVIDPLNVPAGFWRLVFAAAGVVAALWGFGGIGRVATFVWLLTALDLGVMLFMWSGDGRSAAPAASWVIVAYLLCEAALWTLDLYRRLDGATPIISWRTFAAAETGSLQLGGASSAPVPTLLGDLDISASMLMMAAGMAYMLVAMVLGS